MVSKLWSRTRKGLQGGSAWQTRNSLTSSNEACRYVTSDSVGELVSHAHFSTVRERKKEEMARFVCNVISYTLRRTVDITVIIPTPTFPDAAGLTGVTPKHTPSAPYPVLYLLHGGGNNHATWTGYTNVEFYAEERNIAVVMPSGENKFYVDW